MMGNQLVLQRGCGGGRESLKIPGLPPGFGHPILHRAGQQGLSDPPWTCFSSPKKCFLKESSCSALPHTYPGNSSGLGRGTEPNLRLSSTGQRSRGAQICQIKGSLFPKPALLQQSCFKFQGCKVSAQHLRLHYIIHAV